LSGAEALHERPECRWTDGARADQAQAGEAFVVADALGVHLISIKARLWMHCQDFDRSTWEHAMDSGDMMFVTVVVLAMAAFAVTLFSVAWYERAGR
jgi:hypothetical protein